MQLDIVIQHATVYLKLGDILSNLQKENTGSMIDRCNYGPYPVDTGTFGLPDAGIGKNNIEDSVHSALLRRSYSGHRGDR